MSVETVGNENYLPHYVNLKVCLKNSKLILLLQLIGLGLWCLMPLSTIFQLYIGAVILLVEETRVHGENHRPVTSH
jgi:hypothetical protein